MAITERYVTQASAGGTGTFGDPWNFATAVANAVAGDRVNIQSDAVYSIGATTFPAGSFTGPIIWRGYDATIGDCDNLGRNANGTLNTTGMPSITITGAWNHANSGYTTFQNLNITGALSSALISNNAGDILVVINCRIQNTQNNASARCILHDDTLYLLNSDFICSGASHDFLILNDNILTVIGCRFELTAADDAISSGTNAVISGSVFIKNGSLGGNGIRITSAVTTTIRTQITHCTFYNLTAAIISTATHTGNFLVCYENHCTDCTQYITNTTSIIVFDIHSRTRDITSPPSTVELIEVAAITTDTGGASTDFVDAAGGDLHLITTAPGYNAGWHGADIGGLQTDPPAGSGMIGGGNLSGGFQ